MHLYFSFSQIFKELTLTIVLFPFPSILPSCFYPISVSSHISLPNFHFLRYFTRHSSFFFIFTSARQGGGIVSRFRYPRDILTANGAIIIHQIGSGLVLKPRQIGQRKYLFSPAIFFDWRFYDLQTVVLSQFRRSVFSREIKLTLFRLLFSLSNK